MSKSMNLGFIIKDSIQKIIVKFTPATLPTAVKPYHLKVVHQTELDISGIANKAAVYNIPTSPKLIEEGLNAGFELMYYLAATGFKLKTPLFTLKMGFPGEYEGTEKHLPEGVYPVPRIRINPDFRRYLKDKVDIVLDGKDICESFISDALDIATGNVSTSEANVAMTRGNILTINGSGLKIESDEDHKDLVGIFFVPKSGVPIKATNIAVNSPTSLVVHIPNELKKGETYKLAVETQCSARNSGTIVKNVRDIRSNFALIAA